MRLSLILSSGLLLVSFGLACAHSTPPMQAAKPLSPSGVESTPLCALVGPHSGRPGVYGTDLGYLVASSSDKRSPLYMLFGDTWSEAGDRCRYPEHESDDLFATLPAQLPPDLPRGLSADGKIPPCNLLKYELEDPEDVTSWKRMHLFQHKVDRGDAPALLSMGMLRTPVGAFRTKGATYGLFFRNDPAPCETASDCPKLMGCSASLPRNPVGRCDNPPGAPEGGVRTFCRNDDDCILGGCEMEGPAMCMSQAPFFIEHAGGIVAPSWYRDDARKAVAQTIYIGRMVGASPGDFIVEQRFVTNRFVNVAARTVAYFDPAHPERNDYRPGHHTLLLFGRPAFVGTEGSQSLPFLLYQHLPESPDAPLEWSPRFFAGYSAGKPRWTEHEELAQPIYGAEATLAQDDEGQTRVTFARPEFDVVNQASVSYVEALKRWVMLYGGDVPDFLVPDAQNGGRATPGHKQPAPGAVHMRTARHPWGGPTDQPTARWSDAVPALTPRKAAPTLVCPEDGDKADAMPGCLDSGDPEDTGSLLGTVLHLAGELNPGAFFKVYANCVYGEFAMAFQMALSGDTVGRMYGATIIEPWTQAHTDPAGRAVVDLYWAVSTWNPYEVFLIKTTIADNASHAPH